MCVRFARVEVVLAVALVALVVAAVLLPLRAGGTTVADEDPRVADLEARKEAKYREIRDAELDREQGKLSAADWERADAELRREAIEILRALDEARARSD